MDIFKKLQIYLKARMGFSQTRMSTRARFYIQRDLDTGNAYDYREFLNDGDSVEDVALTRYDPHERKKHIKDGVLDAKAVADSLFDDGHIRDEIIGRFLITCIKLNMDDEEARGVIRHSMKKIYFDLFGKKEVNLEMVEDYDAICLSLGIEPKRDIACINWHRSFYKR